MSKKQVRRMDTSQKQMLIQLRKNIREAMDMFDKQKWSLGRYVKFGQDLYLTSNGWLFTEETRTDPAKAVRSIELILLCRKYYDGIIRNFMELNQLKAECTEALKKLKDGGIDDALQKWMGEIIPRSSAIGENVAVTVTGLIPVRDEKLDEIKATMPVLGEALVDLIKGAEDSIEELRAGNMQNVDPEEEAAQLQAMEDAIAEVEKAEGGVDANIPTMPTDPVLDSAMNATHKAFGVETLDEHLTEKEEQKALSTEPEEFIRQETTEAPHGGEENSGS